MREKEYTTRCKDQSPQPLIFFNIVAMSLFVQQSDEEEDNNEIHINRESLSCVSFSAATTQIAHLADVFQSLISINNQAVIRISSKGITIYSTYNHTFNVHVNIDPSLFNNYNISSDNIEDQQDEIEIILGVDINLITECFVSVVNTLKFEKSVSCYFSYHGEGSPLVIEFEDSYMSEKLEFYTFYIENGESISDDNLFIDYGHVCLELMVRCDVLTNLLQDLNQINTENLFIYVAENTLNFISNGPIGTSKLIFPNDKTILEKLEINSPDKNYVILQFNFDTFFKVFRSVKLSSKCKILKDLNGCFSIQLLCKNLPLSKYSGTLITINMMELNHDEFMIGWILNDSEEEQELQESLHPRQSLAAKPTLQRKDYPNLLPTTSTEPLINSFKKSRRVEVPSTMDTTDRGPTRESKKRKRTEEVRNVGGAVEVPLFL